MAGLGKYLSLCLVVILASSVLMIQLTNAQSIPKPSVPEFTINLTDSSYETKPTSTIDPYTGKTVTNPSQHIEARTIQIKIKSVDFTPFEIQNNSNTYTVNLQYNIRWKGQFGTDWHTLFNPYAGFLSMDNDADYTVLSYNCSYSPDDGLNFNGFIIPVNATVEFQVEALVGYIHHIYTNPGDPYGKYVFEGQTSGWSNTQTITIPNGSSSVTPAPSSTNSQSSTTPTLPPETISDNSTTILLSIVIATLVISVILLLMYVRHLKKNNAIKN